MDKNKTRRQAGPAGGAVTGTLALVLVMCLVECASEQGINGRGSKSANLVEKVNGWRSQRGGSCLSYGHSCWGAHGKRSGKPPAAAPDWFLNRLIRRMDANNELNRAREPAAKNGDINAIYQVEVPEDSSPNDRVGNEDAPPVLAISRNPEAKPMLDDELISKMKFWQIMREASEEK